MMVLSSSQQLVMVFTAVLLLFLLFPRMFSGGGGESSSFSPRESKRGPGPGLGPGTVKNQQQMNGASLKPQSVENVHQMKKLMEQEMKSDKYKSNNNKGFVFTLMPIYAIGVGLFAAYKFMKIKSANGSEALKAKTAGGVQRSEETENQLKELEQRLNQTEKMLSSILTQLDPLTNCVKSVAMEQKSEIMSQLHCIRQLMKKRGLQCEDIRTEEPACQRNLDQLIETLAAVETLPEMAVESQTQTETQSRDQRSRPPDADLQESVEDEERRTDEELQESVEDEERRTDEELQESVEDEERRTDEELQESVEDEEGNHADEEADLGNESDSSMPSLEDSGDVTVDDVIIAGKVPDDLMDGLRRRNRPE